MLKKQQKTPKYFTFNSGQSWGGRGEAKIDSGHPFLRCFLPFPNITSHALCNDSVVSYFLTAGLHGWKAGGPDTAPSGSSITTLGPAHIWTL